MKLTKMEKEVVVDLLLDLQHSDKLYRRSEILESESWMKKDNWPNWDPKEDYDYDELNEYVLIESIVEKLCKQLEDEELTDEDKVFSGKRITKEFEMIHTPQCISIHKDKLICKDWIHQITPEDEVKGNVVKVRLLDEK